MRRTSKIRKTVIVVASACLAIILVSSAAGMYEFYGWREMAKTDLSDLIERHPELKNKDDKSVVISENTVNNS